MTNIQDVATLYGLGCLALLIGLGLIFFLKTGSTRTSNEINYDVDYMHNDR